jgi:hypothetical protein
MATSLVVAGALLIVLALVHSTLGEMLIFRHVRRGKLSHAGAIELLPQRRWDAIWSSWHLVTLLGSGLGLALIASAVTESADQRLSNAVSVIAAMLGLASVYWLLGTRGKHPAWIILLLIAVVLAHGLNMS